MRVMRVRNAARVAACLVALVVLGGCDWLQAGYGPGHANYTPDAALTPANVGGLTQKLKIDLTTGDVNDYFRGPIVAGNTLYVTRFEFATGTARVEAYDTTSGTQVFSTTLAEGVSRVVAPVAANGSVYVATDDATHAPTLYAVSGASGSITWSAPLDTDSTADLSSDLTIDKGMLLAVDFVNLPQLPQWKVTRAIAVDATNGANKWTSVGELSVAANSHVTVSSQGLVSFAYTCCPQVGQPLGHLATDIVSETDGVSVGGVDNAYLLTSANGLLYGNQIDPTTGVPGKFIAVDPTTSSVVWSHDLFPSAGSPAVSGRSIIWSYFSNDTAVLSTLDARTGCACADQWTSPPANGATAWSNPVIAGGLVFWVTTDGTTASLRANDATTGSQAAAITLPTNSTLQPIVANREVYIADGTSITAFGLSS